MSRKFRDRMQKAQDKIQGNDVEYVFLTPDFNMYYVSGYEGEIHERHFFLVISQDESFFFVPDLYEEQIRDDTWIKDIRTWSDSENPRERLGEELEEQDPDKVLVSEEMQARFLLDLRKIFSDAEFRLSGEVFEQLRLRKSHEEVDKIRNSSKIADEVIEDLRKMNEEIIGMTENELADVIKDKMSEKGGEEPSFTLTASSGANGAKPHYSHGEEIIEEREPVVLDFGYFKDHYPSDQTRTLVFDGEPSEKFKEVHEIVRKAQQNAVEKVEPGTKAKEVDKAARKVIKDAGYGKEFIHRTGHGVGLELHEPPYINQENSRELEEGMVFSVEPGIYIEGEFGVRIEDLVVVTEDGCKRLNKTDRSWR